jgi:ATP-dependent helicase HrpB
MSATLDAAPVAAMLDNAPVVVSEGRAFPVETRWLARPVAPEVRFETAAASLAEQAVGETEGGVLVFLPGEAEIRRVEGLLKGRLPEYCDVRPLYGAMAFGDQRGALAPAPPGRRKVVLATSIAETSLTIPDVRVVIDCGRARRARFDPGSGMSRLVTERATRAEAEQRRGRAGRLATGVCYRMWTKGEEGGMAAFPLPEIAAADLAGLALELALWGSDAGLAFLTPPPAPALAEARALLEGLGALDEGGRITAHGRVLAGLPVHPRLGHMLAVAGPEAAVMAALLEERDPLRGAEADLSDRLRAVDRPPEGADRGVIARVRAEAKRLGRMIASPDAGFGPAEMAALAYPDRVGMRRGAGNPGNPVRYILSGGKGAFVAAGDPLGREDFIVATDLDGDPREAKVRIGIGIAEASVRRLFADRIGRVEAVEWSRREGRVVARLQERLGALTLAEGPLAKPDPEAVARAAFEGVRALGLPWSDGARRFRARVEMLRSQGADLPDMTDAALLADGAWLMPWLQGKRTEAELRAVDLTEALKGRLSREAAREIDSLAPAAFETPLGRTVAIDYEGESPAISVRLQEMFGVTEHPVVGPLRVPLRVTLLSPAGRPIAVTTDLPGFWRGSYADVRKDMRGQYPRHPWPEEPGLAQPTLRAKPRT